jgi:serine/threonine-protein kinase
LLETVATLMSNAALTSRDGAAWWPETPDRVFRRGDVIAGVYEIRSVLGTGAMGQVYEAYDRALARLVAIKTAVPSDNMPPLRHEAQALAALRHPSLVAVHAIGMHKGMEYIVMERVGGLSLEQHLDQRRASSQPFSELEAIEILRAAAEALSAIHDAGIVHRDLKPANIILAPAGRVVLMDFGTFLPEFDSAPVDDIIGTPLYMAPETIQKTVHPGARHLCDLYALGVLAYEMLTLEMPFDANSILDTLRKHLHEPVPDILSRRSELSPRLAQLITDLLRKDPMERPQSAEAVAWRLRKIAEAPEVRARPLSALLVDDAVDATTLLSMMIQRLVPGAEIHVARDARTAIHVVHRRHPSLILLDLDMPGMNGIELCMYLRGSKMAERARIVVVSGRLGTSERRLLRQLGVHEMVEKGPQVQRRLPVILADFGPIHRRRPTLR